MSEANEDGIESHMLVAPEELEAMVSKGEVTDTKVIALLHLALVKLREA